MTAARVLVVDDNDLQREVVADVLAHEGYDVATAATGAEALASARRRRPHVLVLDLMLPDIDGGTVLRRMRDDPATAAMGVVVTTGMHGSQLKRLLAVDAALSKPFDLRELLSAIALAALRGQS